MPAAPGVDPSRAKNPWRHPQYRPLGHSGLLASQLDLGTLQAGGREGFEKCGGIDLSRLFDIAFDADVNLVDTADRYSNGLAEQRKTLERRRDR